VDVTMLLCDYAEAVNGKLYIMGAGWEQVRANAPVPVSVALIVTVPWDQTNVQHELIMELTDEDGHRISLGEPPQEVVQHVTFEAGRPPGVKPGTSQNAPLALRFNALPLSSGGYSFVVRIDGVEKARVSFYAKDATGPLAV
jgi:hypothetical protein